MTHVLHRSLHDAPELAVRGEGIMLTLRSGKRIIDAAGGAAVSCIGHGNRRVVEAIAAAAGRLDYAATGFFTSEPAEALAEWLLGDEPGGLTRAFFVSSGSEAMESAIKMARQYFVEQGQHQRTHIIARRQGYHGNTFAALAASGHAARRSLYEPMLPQDVSLVSPCFAYHEQRPGEGDADYVGRLADELDAAFRRAGPERVMAFCAETVVGATSGCVTALPGYFPAIRAVCDRYGALLVLDEVMSGMGRTGTMHAWEQEGVTPDLQAVAKGLGGGYQPIGALLVSRRVVDVLAAGTGAFAHGHTYQAHPVACAAALEVQHIIREENLLANVRAMGARLDRALQERFGNHPHVGDIRGRGLFWALEFVADRATRRPFDPALGVTARVKAAGLANGIALYPSTGTIDGLRGDHAIAAPPFNVEADMIDRIADHIDATVNASLAGL